MHLTLHGLRSEKFTFAIVISILLFSLIYIARYTMVVKEENEQFRNEIKAIQQEMNVLFEFLPANDPISHQRKNQITKQVAQIQQQFYENTDPVARKQVLLAQLGELKAEVGKLKTHVKKVVVDEQNPQVVLAASETASKPEETLPKEPKMIPVGQIQPIPTPTVQVIVQNKLSVYYFKAFSSDHKNRHHRTRSISLELQLTGDVSAAGDGLLAIEIRDPENMIISTGAERIKASSDFTTNFTFIPVKHSFKKGRYSVRIFKNDIEFQSVTFLDLI